MKIFDVTYLTQMIEGQVPFDLIILIEGFTVLCGLLAFVLFMMAANTRSK